jgi:hypothetical protein
MRTLKDALANSVNTVSARLMDVDRKPFLIGVKQWVLTPAT